LLARLIDPWFGFLCLSLFSLLCLFKVLFALDLLPTVFLGVEAADKVDERLSKAMVVVAQLRVWRDNSG
jgi:hypothetical protein